MLKSRLSAFFALTAIKLTGIAELEDHSSPRIKQLNFRFIRKDFR